jgi:hypothetical protein
MATRCLRLSNNCLWKTGTKRTFSLAQEASPRSAEEEGGFELAHKAQFAKQAEFPSLLVVKPGEGFSSVQWKAGCVWVGTSCVGKSQTLAVLSKALCTRASLNCERGTSDLWWDTSRCRFFSPLVAVKSCRATIPTPTTVLGTPTRPTAKLDSSALRPALGLCLNDVCTLSW